MNGRRKVVILTGISGSGKTSLQRELMVNRGWVSPYNYTTRDARNDDELDEYIFLTSAQFLKKVANGEMLEYVYQYNTHYGISSTLPEGKNVLVLSPEGRDQVIEEAKKKDIEVVTYFLSLPEEEQEARLVGRGDSPDKIEQRLREDKSFSPTSSCTILDGLIDSELLADIIENEF